MRYSTAKRRFTVVAVMLGAMAAAFAAPAAAQADPGTDHGRRAGARPSLSAAHGSGAVATTDVKAADAGWWNWRNVGSGKCLGVTGGNMSNGTRIVQWDCNGHDDQYWAAVGLGDGSYYELRNKANSSKCLGVDASSGNEGAWLLIWDCNGHTDQLWTVVRSYYSDGSFAGYVFVNYNSSQVIGIDGGRTDDGAPAIQWHWDGTPNQRWL